MDPWKIEPARDLNLPPAKRLQSERRENGLVSTAMHLACWPLTRTYLALWHRLSIEGSEHIPAKPPFVLVANHASHLDALVLAAALPWRLRDHVFPIAAGDVFFQTPLISAFAAGTLNALPMWRKKCGPHVIETLRRRMIDDPCAYILFPEGTRSRDGAMASFKPGLGMMVAGADVPVVPCHLSGCFDSLPANCRVPRPKKIRVRIGPSLNFAAENNDRDGWRSIVSKLEASVRALNA